jgi:hypothetical protein
MQTAKKRYIVLDSWRGIAAMCVVLMHFYFNNHLHELAFIQNSFLFVDFFFVLSGFVITHTYYHSLQGLAGLRLFIIKRFARLWPLHFTATMMIIVMYMIKEILSNYLNFHTSSTIISNSIEDFSVSLFLNLILAHDVWPFNYNDFNGPSWSISVEFFTYILFALLAVYLKRRWHKIVWLALSLIGATVIFKYSPQFLENQTLGIFRCFYGFFLGCITYQMRNLPLRSTTSVELVAVVFMYLIMSKVGYGVMNMLTPLVFAFAIFVFAQERGRISCLLRTKAFRVLGTLSYSIYLTHYIFIYLTTFVAKAIEQVLQHDVRGVQGIPIANQWVMDFFTLLFVAIVVGFSFLTYKYIEIPWQFRINRAMLPDSESAIMTNSYTAPVYLILESWGIGGTEIYVERLVKYLQGKGYRVRLVFLARNDIFENDWGVQSDIVSLFSLRRFLQENNAKLCHLHLYANLLPTTAMIKTLGIPVLTTLHMPVYAWGARHRIYTKLAIYFANRVVGVSKDVCKGLTSGNIYSCPIPGPVDRKFTQVQRNNTNTETFTVITVGRLSKEKRLDVLIRAMQICSSKLGKNSCLVHFGEGPLHRELSTLAHELGVTVEWKGVQSSVAIADALAQADVFVLPSQFEGLPLSAVEAMSTGVTIILSEFPSAKELVTDGVTGHTFPIGNSYALAELLLWHSDHPDLSVAIGKAGRDFVVSQFSEDRCFGQYLTLYGEMLHDLESRHYY